MTLRLQMLQTVRLAQQLLGESSDSVRSFISKQYTENGAFADRSSGDDLYYSVFGLECTQALQVNGVSEQAINYDLTQKYLQTCLENNELDLVHLTSLCRCMGSVAHMQGEGVPETLVQQLCQRLEMYRSEDGSYNQEPSAAHGSAYAAFVVLDAYQSLQLPIPDRDALITSIQSVRCADGSYGFQPGALQGTTPTTAAAVLALRECGIEPEAAAHQWLRDRFCGLGGFTAGPLTPVPDLLSTACALYTMSIYGDHADDLREPCLDFIDSLWSSQGSFYGHWEEEALDCEYTYYGLLALGSLYSNDLAQSELGAKAQQE
ncbi:MAG: terpene cyclase/mutase family protein [Planctomycetes bacterium]|nr:terpene cyclase/mutase family protein [Planctomycetota bacterium]